jgi:hypothetical protein
MKIQEAIKARIPRIRQSVWANPHAYLRLPLMAGGTHGPWAELYDDRVQRDVLGIRPGSQRMCVALPEVAGSDGFEPYTGPISPYEAEGFAKTYLEE